MEYQWSIDKPQIASKEGVVVSQHLLASQAGAEVLAEGGNAVDAAVTAALTIGVVEPWLSGIGGGGFLLYHHASSGRTQGLDFNMIAPRDLDPSHYPLRDGQDSGLFGWPAVAGDRNLKGFSAICVPGAVDGFGQALEHFGTIPWRRALEPAIREAKAGLLVDWYTTLSVATAAAELAEFPDSARRYMPDGWPPLAPLGREGTRLSLGPLADSLVRLSEYGYRDFYEGDLAQAIVRDLRAGGSAIVEEDLSRYRATLVEPAEQEFAGAMLHAMPGLSGGPSFLEAMDELARTLPQAGPNAEAYLAIARAIRGAYQRRLTQMGAGSTGESCTTHISVIDRWGNVASLTNTLLARFGSKVTLPNSGILMNNGIMWFDPVPNRPNSIRAGRKPLANMCPVIITRQDGYRAALGAAGGRRIMPALVHLTAFLADYRMQPGDAMKQPRLDASGNTVIVDKRLPAEIRGRLEAEFQVKEVDSQVYPPQFAVPSVAERNGEIATGIAHPEGPWPGTAVPSDGR